MRVALSIAGSDPSGGGGLQSDLQVFRAHAVHGCGVVTAMTVQDTERVHQVLPAFPNVVLDQLRVVLRGVPPDAIKIGMLATDDVARNVVLAIGMMPVESRVPIVVDPVLFASDGTSLLERRAYAALGELIHGCALVTPNLPEAETLTGIDVSSESGVERAAKRLITEFGAQAALVKGGHRDGAPDDLLVQKEASGVVCDWLRDVRLDVGPVRGTGCALSSAIAARLAHNDSLAEAVAAARAFLRAALAASRDEGPRGRLLAYGSA